MGYHGTSFWFEQDVAPKRDTFDEQNHYFHTTTTAFLITQKDFESAWFLNNDVMEYCTPYWIQKEFLVEHTLNNKPWERWQRHNITFCFHCVLALTGKKIANFQEVAKISFFSVFLSFIGQKFGRRHFSCFTKIFFFGAVFFGRLALKVLGTHSSSWEA